MYNTSSYHYEKSFSVLETAWRSIEVRGEVLQKLQAVMDETGFCDSYSAKELEAYIYENSSSRLQYYTTVGENITHIYKVQGIAIPVEYLAFE
ncbi:hypothetical protein GWI33_011898 [Rhynchophorus ferrugineus]|uniref:Mediator of RNA polymerase II transcription subunit 15 n=1 Tax=Rhynchophorus ferrugineus TaxID=354439 RepID=A0A834IJL5_RHYFE|nr:hypothetical protein GWI33_011898 [Rhynchophorus ferrugineus]